MGLFDKIVASVSDAANGAKEAIKESIEEEKKRKQERENAVGKFLNAKTEPWFTSFKFSKYAKTIDEKRLEFLAFGTKTTYDLWHYQLDHNYQLKGFPQQDRKVKIDKLIDEVFSYKIEYSDLEKIFRKAITKVDTSDISDTSMVNTFQLYRVDSSSVSVSDTELFVLLERSGLATNSDGIWKPKFDSNFIRQEHDKKASEYKRKESIKQFKNVVKDSDMTKKIITTVQKQGNEALEFIVSNNGYSIYGMNSQVIEGYSYQQLGYPDLNDDQLDILIKHLQNVFGAQYELFYDEYDDAVFRRKNAIKQSW